MFALALVAALAASQPASAPAPGITDLPAVPARPPARVQTRDEVMAIPPELLALLQERVIGPGGSREQQVERLVALVFDKDGLAVQYDNDRTRTVAETWRDRRANCLSYTLLFVSLARAAGMDAQVQEVGEVLSWYQDGGVIYSANHVNTGIRNGIQNQTIDVDRNILVSRSRPRSVGDDRAMAHFHNNRGAELMAEGALGGALASLEAALEEDHKFVPAWNNLGVLLQRLDDTGGARRALETGHRLDPDHASTLTNLVALYRRIGEDALARNHALKLDQIQANDPFHQFMLAMECENRGDYACAISHYRVAIRIQEGEHQFHFGLARAYFLDGQPGNAQRELGRALTLGGSEQVREVYRRKLDHLRRWQAGEGQALYTP